MTFLRWAVCLERVLLGKVFARRGAMQDGASGAIQHEAGNPGAFVARGTRERPLNPGWGWDVGPGNGTVTTAYAGTGGAGAAPSRIASCEALAANTAAAKANPKTERRVFRRFGELMMVFFLGREPCASCMTEVD